LSYGKQQQTKLSPWQKICYYANNTSKTNTWGQFKRSMQTKLCPRENIYNSCIHSITYLTTYLLKHKLTHKKKSSNPRWTLVAKRWAIFQINRIVSILEVDNQIQISFDSLSKWNAHKQEICRVVHINPSTNVQEHPVKLMLRLKK